MHEQQQQCFLHLQVIGFTHLINDHLLSEKIKLLIHRSDLPRPPHIVRLLLLSGGVSEMYTLSHYGDLKQ